MPRLKDLLTVEGLPRLDLEVVLSHVLGESREFLMTHGEDEPGEDVVALFGQYVQQLREGRPVAYIVARKEFYGLDFYVDERVLIPRPETEFLVERGLEFGGRVLDVGTGSGNVAVALAKTDFDNEGRVEEVLAVDLSEDALEVARVNAESHGVEHLVHFVQSDLLDFVEEGERFDAILANLPYIGTEKNNFVAENVAKHEPATALFAGSDGLVLYERMFEQLKNKRIKFSLLVGEFADGQAKDLEELLIKYFDQNWRIEKDGAGIPRFFIVEKQ